MDSRESADRVERLRKVLEKIAYGIPYLPEVQRMAQNAIREDDLKYGVPIRVVCRQKKSA